MMDNEYQNSVPVELVFRDSPGTFIETQRHDEKVGVTFDIDINHRSWGIAGIHLFLKRVGEIAYERFAYPVDGPEDGIQLPPGTITIDPKRLVGEKVSGDGVTIYSLHIEVDATKDVPEVDYTKSYYEYTT